MRLDEAFAELNKAIALDSASADAYNNMGLFRSEVGNYQLSIQLLKKSIVLNPKDDNARYNLGNTYYRNKDYKKATLAFRQTVRLDAAYGKAFYGLGLAQWNDGEKDLGCTNLKQALNVGYSDAANALAQFCQ